MTTADVPANYVAALRRGVEETSVANARAYVKNLVNFKETQKAPATLSPSTTTAATTPSSKPHSTKPPVTTTTVKGL